MIWARTRSAIQSQWWSVLRYEGKPATSIDLQLDGEGAGTPCGITLRAADSMMDRGVLRETRNMVSGGDRASVNQTYLPASPLR